MRVAVVGGTGTLGRATVLALEARGHDVRALARHAPHRVDLATGRGLHEALTGCDVVVDATNAVSVSRARTAAVLVDGTRRLIAAEQQASVTHHVGVSIVGCERVRAYGYYAVKAEQEVVVESSPVPWTLVRATQFHDLLGSVFAGAARARVLPGPGFPLQPVAVADVAAALADVVEAGPRRGRVTVAGPEVSDVAGLARQWVAATGTTALVVPLRVLGASGRALRAGALTCADPDVRGAVTFRTWLAAR
ncbi:uncharacterized protein YbjT (DUF2867 family) [Sediminihabitans luteus]|uniref:Uncharacterized protein YbjT (DUF2867 family) n=1 Tax=Sediminihabitans luteus TaxID=1138585 RepID=A0A2M9D131_9CELL|nr:NAD(P)H-binding protein [Sediminihabitans luteus]PJJ77870.1 uncharacterized protein YbjT (DUF2867 family) [Sediminihabitans luteus]GII99772.1 nucleotide-diphosphate-sugar epimerase [Sediminihabitans luteus]